MSDYGKETITIAEVDQPLCTRTYGDAFFSPSGSCSAVLGTTGSRKCHNTRATCQDEANYDPGTLTLQFSRDQQGLAKHYGYLIPSLLGLSTTPGSINLAAMESSASALGQREVVTLSFQDHRHSDLLVDKYRLERATGEAASGSPSETFDPYKRGTFWGKWLARNPYHTGYALRVREGFVGDALADMRVRHYVIDRIEGPTDGQVKIVAKDRFSIIEAQKAVAPVASRGELAANITGTPATFTVTPAGIGNTDYPLSGHVAIGDEIIQFTRSGDTFTVAARGALNTTQEDHDREDLVQVVLSHVAQLGHDIVWDLLVNYTSLASSGSPTGSDYINKTQWDALAASITELFTGRIATPTPVNELIGELCEQAGFTVWHDVSTNMIRFAALRAGAASPVVNDRDWIVDGSLSLKRNVSKRASQVWVYYGQVNPIEDLNEKRNFRSRFVSVDAGAESDTQYAVPAIREVYSRWIPQFGRQSAERCADRILAMYRDPPLEARFALHASRDGELDLARYFFLKTSDVQDESGAEEQVAMAAVEIERGENEIAIRAQAVAFSGDSETSARVIYIENDVNNINLRAIHDSLYAAPEAGSPSLSMTFIVLAGVTVGSTSTSTAAMRTGSWPAGVDLSINNNGRIQGKGGVGGQGGDATTSLNGVNGESGGDALLVESAMTIDNTHGEIWGGSGGGGGGAAIATAASGGGYSNVAGGGGGPGGAGSDPGNGAAGGVTFVTNGTLNSHSTAGTAATSDLGGTRGLGGSFTAAGQFHQGGIGGGAGIFPGNDGVNGGAATGVSLLKGTPGTGGTKGEYVNGNSLVTWIDMGDVRGGVA